MYKIKCIIILLFFATHISAQKADTIMMKKFSIKINPIQLAVSEVRLQAENYFNDHHSVELIASYIFNYEYPHKDESSWQNGFKIGLGYRYYFNDDEFYFNPLFFYKYIKYQKASSPAINGFSFASQPEGGWPKYNGIKQVYSLQLHCGKTYRIKQLLIDTYFGAGLRYREIDLNAYDDEMIWPSVSVGVNIGFIK